MSFFRKFFGNNDGPVEALPSMPWDCRPSIYGHVHAHVIEGRPGLAEAGKTLPDEQRISSGSKIRWAAGALDGVMGHHMGASETEENVRNVVQLVTAYCRNPTTHAKAEVYKHIVEGRTLAVIDPVTEALIESAGLNHERLYELAYSFVTEASDREPVKFGLAILGLFKNPSNIAVFQTLGQHGEFTLFAAVALARCSDDPERALWSLAKNVDGWGRIHIVERLSDTEDPEIKRWLLREGYKNAVMHEYVAYTCATAGGLLAALSEHDVDRELLTSAGEILSALVIGGPAQDINDYDDGAAATELFLGHMESAAETLDDFSVVHVIQHYLNDDEVDWEERSQRGWTAVRRNQLLVICDQILKRPYWTDKSRAGLSSDDEMVFHSANRVAEVLGLETWDSHWGRLRAKAADSGRWYQVMSRCGKDQIAEVIAFAEQTIDVEKIATGPADEMGLGPGWEHHQCLDYVLQELRRFPGYGRRLIQTGLRSPVVSNRNKATEAMSKWTSHAWDNVLREALTTAAKIEPRDDVRNRMEKLLRGEPLED